MEKTSSIRTEGLVEQQQQESTDYSGAHVKIDPTEIKLVRKLDLIILPVLWTMYFLNFLDRNAIAVARLNNIEDELKLSSVQYNTCVSILFVGYVLGQVPSNMFMTRVRPSWYMGSCMALWAIVSTMTGVVTNFRGLLLTRFFLGITESCYYPGALYLLSLFYSRKEIATRISVLFTGSICGTAFAGFIAIGSFQISGVAGLSGWRWLFIIQGTVTFVLAATSAFILPDEPLNTRWLTSEERQLAHNRIATDTVEGRTNTSVYTGLKDAVRDRKLWVFVVMQHFHIAASNFKNYAPTIIGTLGFSRNVTLALTCPPYLIAGAISIWYALSSGRMNERTWHITVAKAVAVVGFVLACTTLNIGARYFAMCVFATGVYACNSITLGWVASTCGQTMEKKAVSMAITNAVATMATIYTPYLWPTSDSPRYTIAMACSAAFSIIVAILAWVMRGMLIRENRKLQRSSPDTAAPVLLYAY